MIEVSEGKTWWKCQVVQCPFCSSDDVSWAPGNEYKCNSCGKRW